MKQRIRFGKRACCVAATMSVAAAAFLLPTNGSAGASTVKGSTYELYYTDTGATPAAKYLPAISHAINASGGINGHPLKIVDCDDQGNSNQATQCAQQATSNPHVLGIVGNTSTCGSQLLQTLASAHMASIGDQYFCAGRLQVTTSVSVQRRIVGPGCGRSSWGDGSSFEKHGYCDH